jgi:hypothetical protein
MNWLPLAYVGFFLAFGFLDLITAITVGVMTNALYGVLTFFAGFLPMVVDEVLFVRPYASRKQKILAISGVGLGILSTLGIGILAGVINGLNYFAVLALSNTKWLVEVAMIVGLVVLTGMHGLLWLAYITVDEGTQRKQKRQEQLAYHEEQREKLNDAKAIVADVKEIERDINEIEKQGDLDALDAAITSIGGRSIIADEAGGVMTSDGFKAYSSDVPLARGRGGEGV